MKTEIKPLKSINGEVAIPGDKSISHRALIIGSLAHGTTKITNFLRSEDTLATLNILKAIGANIELTNAKEVVIEEMDYIVFKNQKTSLTPKILELLCV